MPIIDEEELTKDMTSKVRVVSRLRRQGKHFQAEQLMIKVRELARQWLNKDTRSK